MFGKRQVSSNLPIFARMLAITGRSNNDQSVTGERFDYDGGQRPYLAWISQAIDAHRTGT